MARLPQPGKDGGKWGNILNEFLLVDHNADGTLKASGTLSTKYTKPSAGIPETDLSTSVQTKLNSSSGGSSAPVTSASITDATTVGKSLLTAPDAVNARTTIGAGTSNLIIGTTSTTAKAGNYAPTKADVGLGNVDNTTDATKPISTPVATALNAKQDTLSLTTTGTSGAATLTSGVLNIPQYSSGSSTGAITIAGINTLTSDASQAVGSLGADMQGGALTNVAFTTIGNSLNVPDAALQQNGMHYTQLLQTHMRMASLTTKAVGGTTAGQIASHTIANGSSNSIPVRDKSFVGATIFGNNVILGNSAENQKSVREATRTILATLTADAKIASNTSAFTYAGNFATYTSVDALGGVHAGTFNDGEYFEFNFSGAQGVDIVLFATSANSATFHVTEGATLIGIGDTTGLHASDPTSCIFKVRNLGAGTHTIRVTKASGTGMFVDGILIPSTAPRSGYVLGELVPDLARTGYPSDFATTRTALFDIVKSVVAEYPSFTVVDISLAKFDPTVMTADGLHPNDWGQYFVYSEVSRQISRTPYTIGNGNLLTKFQTYPAAYTPPAAPTTPSGGTTGNLLPSGG